MDRFLELHRGQLLSSQVPEHLWPALYQKLSNETFDAGQYFMLAVDEDDDLHAVVQDDCDLEAIQPTSPNAIFLVDHAWTFTAENCRSQLERMPALLARMEQLLRVADDANEEAALELRVSAVLDALWRVANTYRLGSPEMNQRPEAQAKNTAIWYIMDEFGSAIEHAMVATEEDDTTASSANVALAPFFFHDNQTAFSIFWPIQPLEEGDFLTREFVPRAMEKAKRVAMLAALFFDAEATDETPYEAQLEQIVAQRKSEYSLEQARAKFAAVVGRDDEVADDLEVEKALPELQTPIKWYSNLSLMQDHLRHDMIQLVDNESDAQVVWPTWHIKDYVGYAKNDQVAIINQFPNEKILTCKDLLYEMCCLANGGERPTWLAQTFNMESQLPELVHEYIQLARKQQLQEDVEGRHDNDNHWIVKPWNLARSIDTCIARNVAHLARLSQTGPKIACKYISNPVLIDNRKFDCRFLVMLKSIDPLELYVSGVYWSRVANKPFAMDVMDDFEKHFTVMNYSQYQVRYMQMDEFESRFDAENPTESWAQVKAHAFQCIRQLFELATASPPPFGLGNCAKSRALYGVDVMFQWKDHADPVTNSRIDPTILEVNFQPDCTRACRFFPDFYRDLVHVLVLDDHQQGVVHGVTKLEPLSSA